MTNKMFDVVVDTKKITSLQNKLSKYGPYAIQQGLEAANEFMNTADFKMGMYPPDQSGAPFSWSSDIQRQAFFASNGFGGGVPHNRTYDLAMEGEFVVSPANLYIEYMNEPYSNFVIGSSMIVGHRKRGWRQINQYIVSRSREIANIFRKAALDAWEKAEEFIYGGGAGL